METAADSALVRAVAGTWNAEHMFDPEQARKYYNSMLSP
jgi:hypothetical protein